MIYLLCAGRSVTGACFQAGGDARAFLTNGRSVLHCACVGHNAGTFHRVHLISSWHEGLVTAARNQSLPECVSRVIKAGAQVNAAVSALPSLPRRGSYSMTRLFQAKACIGWTPLHELMASGDAFAAG